MSSNQYVYADEGYYINRNSEWKVTLFRDAFNDIYTSVSLPAVNITGRGNVGGDLKKYAEGLIGLSVQINKQNNRASESEKS